MAEQQQGLTDNEAFWKTTQNRKEMVQRSRMMMFLKRVQTDWMEEITDETDGQGDSIISIFHLP